jgi:hypothetical protein
MKPVLTRIARVLAALGLTGLSLACSPSNTEETQFTAKLAASFETLSTPTDRIKIEALTGFEWTSLFIFTPYTPLEHIQASLGTAVTSEIKNSGIEARDNINLFVFRKDQKILKTFSVSRAAVDFTKQRLESLSPQNAVFKKGRQGRVIVLAD